MPAPTTAPAARRDRRRAVVRTVLAVLFAVLTVAALVEPAWVEATTGADPDGGSGALEWALALTAGLATVVAGWSATLAWRRVAASGA